MQDSTVEKKYTTVKITIYEIALELDPTCE